MPDVRKCVILGAPHTSNWDFIFFLGATHELGIRPNFIGKSSLFKWPMTRFMLDMGGVPVERSKSGNYVEQVAAAFARSDDLALVIAPEGSRTFRGEWKTGFYRIAEQAGIQALAIHGRTRADKFNGEAEFHTVRDVVAAVGIPVIANGDINSPQKAQRILETTGASGIMIGRAAQGNPWIFRDTLHYLEHGSLAAAPLVTEVHDCVQQHLAELHQFYGEFMGVRIARKHLGWYTQNLPGGEDFRRGFNTLENAADQRLAIEQFFQQINATTDRVRFGCYGEVSARKKNGALAA